MSYVTSVLRPDETILATGRMHWIVYVRGVVVLVIGLAIALLNIDGTPGTVLRAAGGLIALIGLLVIARAWIEQTTTEIAVTTKRVIQKRGLIWRKTAEMNMDKVESVLVDQSLFGRLLNYGTIVVRGTGSGIEGLHFIADPLALRSTMVVR
jgi:uncharacterized membrane protein YdbT with pleckstrin-like domain